MAKPLGRLATGERVYDRSPSHIHAGAQQYLPEVLGSIRSRHRQTIVQVNEYSQPVGVTSCVATRAGDKILFARRKGRRGVSRFVKNRRPMPTCFLTVILRRTRRGDYEVSKAYFGEPAPMEPWGNPRPSRKSQEFWKAHAFAWGAEPIVRGSEQYRIPR